MTGDEAGAAKGRGLRFTSYLLSFRLVSAISKPPLVIVFALAAFIPSVRGYFLSDDFVLLHWTHVASAGDVAGFFDPHTFWFYRPMVKVYYWLGQSLFQLRPEPYHIFSIVLHGANAYLVYRLASGRGGKEWVGGLAAALLFVFVPYHAETVSWIAATGDLLATTGILSALLRMRCYWASGRARQLVAALTLFTFALFARETAILLPALLLLDMLIFERWPRHAQGRPDIVRVAAVFGAYMVPLLAYLLIQSSGGQGVASRGGLALKGLNFESILLGVMQYVHGLLPGGTLLAQLPLDAQRPLVWAELAIALLFGALFWRLRMRVALFGLLWLLATPLLFVFFSAPADRYFYLPSAGYAMLVASVLVGVLTLVKRRAVTLYRPARVAAAVLVAALLVSEVIALLNREAAWRFAGEASRALFRDTVQADPDPRDYNAFFYIDLPPALNGIPAFGNGLQEAVQLTYDNRTLAATAISCADLRARQDMPRYSDFLRYNGSGLDRLPDKNSCP